MFEKEVVQLGDIVAGLFGVFFRWWSLKEGVGFSETKERRLTPTARKVRKYLLETGMESNPQFSTETQIISWFDFQGLKFFIDSCVCLYFY